MLNTLPHQKSQYSSGTFFNSLLSALAERWTTSISSLRRAIRAGRLPSARPLGKTLVPTAAVIEAEKPRQSADPESIAKFV